MSCYHMSFLKVCGKVNNVNALDRNSPVPLYYQLYTILLKDINDGVFKPGDMLPTEVALMQQYSVSRATVRQAMQVLVQKGYVTREKSKGTFVKDSTVNLSYENKVTGFSATTRLHERTELTSKVLEHKIVVVPPAIATKLGIPEESRVFYLKRVRSVEGKPSVYTEDWVRYDLCEGIENVDFMDKSLHKILEDLYGVIPAKAVRTFDCCLAQSEEQIVELKIKKNQPLLRFTSIVSAADDTPIELCEAVINGKYTVNE